VETEQDAWQSGGLARRLVFEGLTAFGGDGLIHPALATEWQTDANQHRWQFHLRAGVRFHDGTPLTAAAGAASLNSSCESNCPWKSLRATGASLVFSTETAIPNLPALLADDDFLIGKGLADNSPGSGATVGTGPFEFGGDSSGVVSLSANDAHWQGRPFLDSVQIRGHKDVRSQWLDLAAGRADLVEVPPEQMRAAQQQRLNVISIPSSQLLALRVMPSGALANDNLRAALALAIDRNALVNVIFQKQGQATASLLPQTLSGFSFLFPAQRDLDKARGLRSGSGQSRISLACDADGAMQLAAQRLALNLRDASFVVQVNASAAQGAEIRLLKLPIIGLDPAAALAILLRRAALPQTVPTSAAPAALYQDESDALRHNTIVPLMALPQAWALSSRVDGLALLPNGLPDVASASLEASR